MNTATHTPTPWNVRTGDEAVNIYAVTPADEEITLATTYETDAEGERDANAAFIVRACNAHDELVAALKNALHNTAVGDGVAPARISQGAVEAMRAALAKAGA